MTGASAGCGDKIGQSICGTNLPNGFTHAMDIAIEWDTDPVAFASLCKYNCELKHGVGNVDHVVLSARYYNCYCMRSTGSCTNPTLDLTTEYPDDYLLDVSECTSQPPPPCLVNQHAFHRACLNCPNGWTSEVVQNPWQTYTSECTQMLNCEADHYASNGACEECATGKYRTEGDYPHKGNTQCGKCAVRMQHCESRGNIVQQTLGISYKDDMEAFFNACQCVPGTVKYLAPVALDTCFCVPDCVGRKKSYSTDFRILECMCTTDDITCEHGTPNGIIPSCGCTCDRGYEGDFCEKKAPFVRPDITCDSVGTLCARKKKQLKPTVVCPNHRCTTEVCCEDMSPQTCQDTIDATSTFCTRRRRVNKDDLSNTCAKFPCRVRECCDAPTRGCKTDHCNKGTFDIHDESKCFSCSRGTCSNKRCVCPAGFGGTKCDVRISKGAQQEKVKDIRASFSGNSDNDKKQRQNAYKAFVKDIVRAKIAEGASVREAVKEYTLPIAKVDLPLKTAAVITKTPAIASVPDNSDQDDDCHLGASATNCGMVDLKDDRDNNQQTIVSVGDDVGSWAVVVDAGTIVSKQIRTGEDTYDMQCWNGEWEAVEEKTSGDVFECNNRVIFIGSQIGICDETTCLNGGTCVAAGDSFTCTCPILWEGQLCEIPKTAGNDGTSTTCAEAFDNADKIAFQNLNCACAYTC